MFGAAADERVLRAHSIEGRLKLSDEVSLDQAQQDGAAFGRDTRVTGPTPTAALLEKLLTKTHVYQSARPQ